jgi:phytoene dehydrogenase-like protein
VLASILHAEHRFGAWYVEGGLRRIAEVLLARAVSLGVDVRTSTDAVEVVVRGGRAAGVITADGSEIRCTAVVSNADAAHLYRDLVRGPEADGARRALAQVQPSLSGFVICLALDRVGRNGRQLPAVAHHTVLFPAEYRHEFDDLFGAPTRRGQDGHAPRIVAEPAIYVSAPDDPAIAPRHARAWFVLVNAPRHDAEGRGGIDWRAPGLAEREADRIIGLMAARGLDIGSHVRWRSVLTPADLALATRAVGGSIYGTSSNGARAAFLRPPNRSPVPGLFLVGGSSHPGGGLPLVQLSARITAALLEGGR